MNSPRLIFLWGEKRGREGGNGGKEGERVTERRSKQTQQNWKSEGGREREGGREGKANVPEHPPLVLIVERRVPAEEDIGDHTGAPDVHLLAVRNALEDLGGDVAEGGREGGREDDMSVGIIRGNNENARKQSVRKDKESV